jgi:predicted methyltransferase
LLSTVVYVAAGCAHQSTEAASPVKRLSTLPAAPISSSQPTLSVASAETIVRAQDRSLEDRELDKGRHPTELLEFLDLKPGMKVAEIASGGGYTTELLARAVGPDGVVYGQNSRFVLDRFAEKPWSERLKKSVMANVIRVDRDFDDPLPPGIKGLDAVVNVLFYHDTVWQKTDRAKMNRALFEALRPAGVYVIVDHSARQGTGTSETQTNHRIEESVVRDEVEKAGFRYAASADFLRNTSDTRDWNASPRAAADRRGTSDRFVLKFVKP